MLTPEYLLHCTDYLAGMYDILDAEITAEIAEAIAGDFFVTPHDNEFYRLKVIQDLQNKSLKQISITTTKTE